LRLLLTPTASFPRMRESLAVKRDPRFRGDDAVNAQDSAFRLPECTRLFNTAIAMAAMLLCGKGARLVVFPGQGRFPAGGLGEDIDRRGAAIGFSRGDGGFNCQHLVDAAVDAFIHA